MVRDGMVNVMIVYICIRCDDGDLYLYGERHGGDCNNVM